MRRRTSVLLLLSLVASLLPVSSATAQQASASVVISQLYGAGGNSGATLNADYIELRNRTGGAVDLDGLSLQYGSATGNFGGGGNLVVDLDGTIAPGGYFLVQLASGPNGADLPVTPDLTDGNVNLAAANGKVALVTGTSALGCGSADAPCDADDLASVIDLVGFGTANFAEGGSSAPTPSTTTAIFRAADGCTDTNDNGADFTTGTPAPRNSASPISLCPDATITTQVLANPSFEQPGESGVEPDVWEPALFGNEESPFAGGTSLLANDADAEFGPPATIPDGDLALQVRYGVGNSQGEIGYGFEQTDATFATTVDEGADASFSYSIAETSVSQPTAMSWAGSFAEIELASGDSTYLLRYFHPASVDYDDAPEDGDGVAYVIGEQLERNTWASFEQDLTTDVAAAFPDVDEYTITAVRGGVLQDRTSSAFTNMASYFDDVRLEATGVNQPIVASCPALALEIGNGGSVGIAASDGDGTVVSAILGDVPDGVTLDDVVPAEEVGGQLTATLTAPDDLDLGTYPVEITFANDDSTPQTTLCTVTISVAPEAGSITPISTVQGPGSTTPIPGVVVTVEGVVTADHTGDEDGDQLGGFFVESEAERRDDDPLTSEGVFVFAGGASATLDLEVGDLVQVTGAAGEAFGQTQLAISSADDVEVVGEGELPPAVEVTELPPYSNENDEATDELRNAFFEPLEGMRVVLSDTWTVTDNFGLQFGELELVPGDLPLQNFTNQGEPGDAAGAFEFANNNDQRRWTSLTLDDTRDGNLFTRGLELPYLDDEGTVRRGSTLEDQEAILSFGFNRYRLRPVTEDAVDIDHAARPAVPETGGTLTVAAFNVLNYFNGDGQGGGFPTDRGAATPEAFGLQSSKIEQAILEFDADVVGLIEIENDAFGPNAAISDLVERLNDRADAEDLYAVAETPDEDGRVGTDAIAVKFIYKPDVVSFDGYALDDTPPFGSASRVPIAARFTELETDETFVAINNHFKSKGSGTGENADQGDGQAASNLDRILSSQNLLDWIDEDEFFVDDEAVLIIGDLNAYANEDPIVLLEANGFTDLLEVYEEADRPAYTYTFFGSEGRLDHALGNQAALTALTGAEAWTINSDEPQFLEYSRQAPEDDLFRSSDHDPVLVGLDLTAEPNQPPTVADLALTTEQNTEVAGQLVASDPDGDTLTYTFEQPMSGGTVVGNATTGGFTFTPAPSFVGTTSFDVAVDDGRGGSDTATVTITVTPSEEEPPPPEETLECPPGTGSGFPDVPDDSVHADAIRCGDDLELFLGKTDGTFDPRGSLTRGQVASVLDRIATAIGRPIAGDRRTFSDVDGTYVHADAIERLAGAGVILGYRDGAYRPQAPVDRDQLASLVVRFVETTAQVSLPVGDQFTDVPSDSPHAEALAKARGAGIVLGAGAGNADPRDEIRRDQAASLFVRSLRWLPVAD